MNYHIFFHILKNRLKCSLCTYKRRSFQIVIIRSIFFKYSAKCLDFYIFKHGCIVSELYSLNRYIETNPVAEFIDPLREFKPVLSASLKWGQRGGGYDSYTL
jgi:hypothetical protein